MTRVDRVQLLLSRALQAVLAVELAAALLNGRWPVAFITALALGVSFLPAILQRNTNLHVPVQIQLVISAFVFAALFLGEVEGYYDRFSWWDLMLHSTFGIVLGLVTFLGLLALFEFQRVKMSLSLLSVFAVAFAMAVGSLWEMFEFFMDSTFGLNMMKSGLNDTMGDLIVNCLGATASVTAAHLYVVRRATRASWLARALERTPRRPSSGAGYGSER
jgi:hypothetical protein